MRKQLPKGSTVLVKIVGEELRVVVDISHEPWSLLAQELVNTIANVIELYDEEDGYESHATQFKQIRELIAAVKGTLQ